MLFDAGTERGQFVLVEALAWLKRILLDLVQRHFTGVLSRQLRDRGVRATDQGVKPASEAPFLHGRTPETSESLPEQQFYPEGYCIPRRKTLPHPQRRS